MRLVFSSWSCILFSLAEISYKLEGRGLGLSNTHPPHALRRRILFKKVTDGDPSFARVFETHTNFCLTEDFNSPLLMHLPTKNEIFKELSVSDKEGAAVLAELPETMENLESVIYGHVAAYLDRHAPSAKYSSERYETDFRNHFEPLLAAIPPIETGLKLEERSATEFPTILNIGWALVLTKLHELRVKNTGEPLGSDKLERLHALLLKAVELAEARRVWENTKCQDFRGQGSKNV